MTPEKEDKENKGEDYHKIQKENGLSMDEKAKRLWFVEFGRFQLFRRNKWLYDEDMLSGSTVEKMVQKQYLLEWEGGTKREFAGTWSFYGKLTWDVVNRRRSNVANTMKGIFLREYVLGITSSHFFCNGLCVLIFF